MVSAGLSPGTVYLGPLSCLTRPKSGAVWSCSHLETVLGKEPLTAASVYWLDPFPVAVQLMASSNPATERDCCFETLI